MNDWIDSGFLNNWKQHTHTHTHTHTNEIVFKKKMDETPAHTQKKTPTFEFFSPPFPVIYSIVEYVYYYYYY